MFLHNQPHKALIRDQFSVHKMAASEEMLTKRNVQQIFVPVAKTGEYQPLDVGVNKPFKGFYMAEYHEWQKQHYTELTKSGYLKKPGRQEFINMVSVAW